MNNFWSLLTALVLTAATPAQTGADAGHDTQDPPDAPQVLEGRVELVLPDGTRRAPKEGVIVLTIQGGGLDERRIPVSDGEWRYEPEVWHDHFSIAALQLEGRVAFRSDDPDGSWPARPGQVSFEARWLPTARLLVTDREGASLGRVQYVEGPAGFWRQVDLGSPDHDPSGYEWSAPQPSPIVFPEEWDPDDGRLEWIAPGIDPWSVRTFCVRAEGYALAQVRVDPKVGGDVLVSLAREARLELTVRREDDLSRELEIDLIPRFPTSAGMFDWRVPPAARTTVKVFRGLEPGTWLARTSWRRPITANTSRLVYGNRVELELVAGEERSVEIVFADPDEPEPPGVPLRGEVVVPAEWSCAAEDVEILLARLQETSSGALFRTERRIGPADLETTITRGVWRFEAEPAQRGRWAAVVLPPNAVQLFDVTGDGARVAIVVPDPVDVELALTGAGRELSWKPEASEGFLEVPWRTSESEDGGVFRFRAPPGAIRLMLETGRTRVLDLVPGRTRYELTIEPLAELKVELFDGDAPVAFPDVAMAGWLVDEDGEIRYPFRRGQKSGSMARWLGFEESGTFELGVSVPPGYRVSGPVTVELVPGEERTVPVQLLRSEEPR